MEQGKHAILRKLFSGVEQSPSSEAAGRWSSNRPTSKTGSNIHNKNKDKGGAMVLGKGIPATGSVRERAKAFEERYAADSSAYVPFPSRESGSAGQRRMPSFNTATEQSKDSTGMARNGGRLPMQRDGAMTPVDVTRPATVINQHQSQQREEKENVQPSRSTKSAEPIKDQTRSIKRSTVYELPITPARLTVLDAEVSPVEARAGTPRSGKHVSTPATPDHQHQSSNKPTLRAGAFQTSRPRANSTPKSKSSGPLGPRTSQVVPPRPVASPKNNAVSALTGPVTRPNLVEHTQRRDSDDAKVSAVPIPRSRISSGSMRRHATPSSQTPSPSAIQVHTNSSATTHQNQDMSVSAHLVSTQSPRPVSVAQVVAREISPRSPHHVTQKSKLSSSQPAPADDGYAISAPAIGSSRKPKGSVRPRSMTLTGRSTAELDLLFEDFITSLNLPETVSRKMLDVDSRVKLDMLKSGTPSSTLSRATGQNMTGTIARSRMPIPSFGEKTEESSPAKKRPAVLRKMRSFLSNKELREPKAMPDGFLVVEPASPRPDMDDALPSASLRASFDITDEVDPAISQSAATYAHLIRTKKIKALDPLKDVRKLRMLLRHESLMWVSEWIKYGGYRGLMDRLHEILNLEWREEQHDDQVLLELLKCFRGLLVSFMGRQCLAKFAPSPFRPLVELLYSDKRPGDLLARQCIVEILAGTFDIFDRAPRALATNDWRQPWGAQEQFGAGSIGSQTKGSGPPVLQPSSPQLPNLQFEARKGKGSDHSSAWESAGFADEFSFAKSLEDAHSCTSRGKETTSLSATSADSRRTAAYNFVKSLLVGPPNEKEESQVYFMKSTRKTRLFRLWMEEVVGVLSDYFWIFCHSSNSYWRLENIQEEQLEEPKVPGGMTGGVEYEAMEYCASHLRLLNALCKACPAGNDAFELHNDLFMSGLDRVLLTLRKCSTTYYPQVHLELARYIDVCISSGYPLHAHIRKYLEPVTALKESTSASKLAAQASKGKSASAQKGHQRSRTEGQVQLHSSARSVCHCSIVHRLR